MKLSFVDTDAFGNSRGVKIDLDKKVTIRQVNAIRKYYTKRGYNEMRRTAKLTSREVVKKAKAGGL